MVGTSNESVPDMAIDIMINGVLSMEILAVQRMND
jgi:hypothetical protein